MTCLRYIICAPAMSGSAGVRALYLLRNELVAHGHDAQMFVYARKSRRLTSTPNQVLRVDAKTREYDIVVYPETVWGNPLGFRRVVRWVLNTPSLLGGSSHFGDGELVFTWMPRYQSSTPCLRVDTIDHSLFYADHCKRDTDAVFVHKNGRVRTTPELADAVEITIDRPDSRQDLANLLRHTRTLYSHDANSSLMAEAEACGAEVKLITKTGFADYQPFDPPFNRALFEMQLAEFISQTQAMPAAKISRSFLIMRSLLRPLNFVFLCLFAALRRLHPSPWTRKWSAYYSQCVFLHP